MREDELIVLMKKSGFSSRDIKKVRELSIINITTMENALYMLSSMYFKLIKVHAAVVIVAFICFIVEYNNIDDRIFVSIAIILIFGHLAMRKIGSLRLAFKARKLLRKIRRQQ